MNSTEECGEAKEIHVMDLKNHCIFCLQRYSLDEVSSFVGKNIRPFELLRNYFCGGGGVTFQNVKGSSSNVLNQEKNILPACKSCLSHFENLQKLHDQMVDIQELIKVQLKAIRGIVSGAAPTSEDDLQWNHFMEILLTLGQPESQVKMTCELVKNFQRLIANDFERGLDCEDGTAQCDFAKVFKQETTDDLEELDFQRTDFEPNQDDPMSEEGEGLDWIESLPKSKAVKKKPKRKRMFALKKKPAKPTIAYSTRTRQECDLCGVEVPNAEILSHIQEHVKDYATKCPNPTCPCVFSCQMKMLGHLRVSQKCRVAPTKSIRESVGLSGKCQVCEFSARNLYSIGHHLRDHEAEIKANPNTTDAIRECPIPGCSESFYLRQSMEYHLFRHNLRFSNTTQQHCPLCDESLELTEMESHLTDNHQVTEVFKCNHCSFVFNNIDEKIKHVYEHREEKGASCDICNDNTVKIRSLTTFQMHYFNVHQLGSSPAVHCQYCGKEYASSQGLKIHERRVHPDIAGPAAASNKMVYKCDLCAQEYPTITAVKNHKIRVHGAAHLPCRICSETFPSTSLLYTHMRVHTGVLHKCKFEGCNREFKCKALLSDHYENCHWEGKEKPYKCDTCGKGFGLMKTLKRHNEDVHLKTRDRCVCDVCGESFSRQKSLEDHKLIHTGDKPHVCSICGQAFRQGSTLWNHKKSHERKGDSFKARGPFKNNRKRIKRDQ